MRAARPVHRASFWWVLPALAMLAVAPAGCAGRERVDLDSLPLVTTRLFLPISRTPHTLNPLTVQDPVTPMVTRFIFDGLTRLDGKTGAPVPGLAESWEIGSGGKVYTFRIRSDVSWSDGRDFGPEDVLFTFNEAVIPGEMPNPFREFLRISHPGGAGFPKITRVGEQEVRFTLPGPFPALLRALAYCPILPKHRLGEMVGAGYAHLAWPDDVHPRQVVGTGPFTLARILPGEEVRLRRNPHYWERDGDGEPLPRTDEIVFRVVLDGLQAFLKGEVDLLVADAEQLRALEPHLGRGEFQVSQPGPVGESTFLCLRQGEDDLGGLFARREVRQAISQALDRQRMIREVLDGMGRPQWSPISRANPYFHHEKVRTYPHDPGAAARSLDALGILDRDRDGVRETPGGTPLELDLVVGPGGRATKGIASRIVEDLQAIGIRAHIRDLHPEVRLDPIRWGDWDALVLTIPEAYDPQLLSKIWSIGAEAHYWRPRQERPGTPWEAEVDGIFRKAAAETDDGKRRLLYHRFQEIAADEVPLIYTVQRAPAVACRRRVRNFEPSPVGYLHDIARIAVAR